MRSPRPAVASLEWIAARFCGPHALSSSHPSRIDPLALLCEKRAFPRSSLPELRGQKASLLSWLVATVNGSNVIAIVLFCLIGLLVTAIVILRFLDLGAIIAR
jgi:hypothetical protein